MFRLIIAATLALFGTAHAAEPASGTITPDNTVLEFTGGPFAAANIFGQAGEPQCIEPAFPCDFFLVTLDLPDDYISQFPSAIVRMTVAVDSPGANVREDYDVYLYDSDGEKIAEAVSENDPESLGILPDNGENSYELMIVPFTATGSTIKGRVELLPGEPADAAQSRAQRLGSSAGGSLGLGGLVLVLLGLRRRALV